MNKENPDIEIYTSERKAEFLLNNAIDSEDYAKAIGEIRKLGLDPEKVPHDKPKEKKWRLNYERVMGGHGWSHRLACNRLQQKAS